MRRKYLLAAVAFVLFAFAALLYLFGSVNISEFSTGIATGAALTGFGLVAWAVQTAVTEGKQAKPLAKMEERKTVSKAEAEAIARAWIRNEIGFDPVWEGAIVREVGGGFEVEGGYSHTTAKSEAHYPFDVRVTRTGKVLRNKSRLGRPGFLRPLD